MLAKCLNPICSQTFRYLSDGRIFHLEIPIAGDTVTSRRREYFWLCDSCCAKFTVVLKNGTGVVELTAWVRDQLETPQETRRTLASSGGARVRHSQHAHTH